MTQVAETKRKTVTAKIFEETLDAIKDRQNDVRKATRVEPNQSEVIEEAIAIAQAMNWRSELAGLTPDERADAEAYIQSLRSGQELTTIKCPKSLRKLLITLVTVAQTNYQNEFAADAKQFVLDTLDNFGQNQPK